MRFETSSRARVLDSIETEFGFKNVAEATKLGAISEHIRAAVCLGSRPDGGSNREPVATATITRAVVQRLSPVWPELSGHYEQSRSPIVDEIEQLSTLGELVKVDSHHWLPAPSRVVAVSRETELLISCVPLTNLPYKVRRATQVVGRCRLLDINLRSDTSILREQRLADWLRVPSDDIQAWFKAFSERSASSMAVVEELLGVEIFIDGRWKQCGSPTEANGLHLYRRTVFGSPAREYGLCRLKQTAERTFEIQSAHVISRPNARRFQAVLASRVEWSRRVKYRVEGNTVTVFLPRPFPEPEDAFLKLGWRCSEQSAADWPRQYTFSTRLLPLIERAVGLLGHTLIEQTNGV